jgi:DNA-binding HxlR family transcriptional regulator
MTTRLVPEQQCSIARSLEVLGEKWTLLVVRDALAGTTRFSDFQQSLGIAKNLLTDRLTTLVEFGVMERRSYRDEGSRERSEYVLTETGRELRVVIAAFIEWGDVHRPTPKGPTRVIRDSQTGDALRLAFVNGSGAQIPQDRVFAETVR